MSTIKPYYARLRQIETTSHPQREVDGVAFRAPVVGECFYLETSPDKVFRTSAVQEITVNEPGELVIRTNNSVYALTPIERI